jgi:hypothetical protein
MLVRSGQGRNRATKEEEMKRARAILLSATIAILSVMLLGSACPAAAQGTAALSGIVASAEEGRMEGVIVSASRAGGTRTISVTDPVTVWTGSNHSGVIVKLEPLD